MQLYSFGECMVLSDWAGIHPRYLLDAGVGLKSTQVQ